jgi:hypothetical protein
MVRPTLRSILKNAVSWQPLKEVRSTSSRFGFDDLDRLFSIIDSVGISALPPKLQLGFVTNVP